MLYSVIKPKDENDFIRVGLVAKNDNNEIMLVSETIDRINKSVNCIPYVDVKEFNAKNIISEFNNKYGIKINEVQNYINETSFLDEMCNERLQVNMAGIVNNNISGVKWSVADDILISMEVPMSVKQCIEVYNYNSNIN